MDFFKPTLNTLIFGRSAKVVSPSILSPKILWGPSTKIRWKLNLFVKRSADIFLPDLEASPFAYCESVRTSHNLAHDRQLQNWKRAGTPPWEFHLELLGLTWRNIVDKGCLQLWISKEFLIKNSTGKKWCIATWMVNVLDIKIPSWWEYFCRYVLWWHSVHFPQNFYFTVCLFLYSRPYFILCFLCFNIWILLVQICFLSNEFWLNDSTSFLCFGFVAPAFPAAFSTFWKR